ncbi:hypothetical protein BOTBODRAFT_176145 [Botryobasidium botryosum FD-172 SS1]|uniref:Uncharacterized protein n=1 Tax=Botryobasidium botryosum (strain FD-172 SS1) TaxID=930990 RepID=A0A067MLF3_BOTB1|nr:hypothetical protein BOTBODRAFT_176145 [Botryobasidium botryosum FD-172 SS1]
MSFAVGVGRHLLTHPLPATLGKRSISLHHSSHPNHHERSMTDKTAARAALGRLSATPFGQGSTLGVPDRKAGRCRRSSPTELCGSSCTTSGTRVFAIAHAVAVSDEKHADAMGLDTLASAAQLSLLSTAIIVNHASAIIVLICTSRSVTISGLDNATAHQHA